MTDIELFNYTLTHDTHNEDTQPTHCEVYGHTPDGPMAYGTFCRDCTHSIILVDGPSWDVSIDWSI